MKQENNSGSKGSDGTTTKNKGESQQSNQKGAESVSKKGAGKHKYKYLVDGKWITDPNNKNWEQNEFGTGNSIIWVEK